jgi:acyl dehydratase
MRTITFAELESLAGQEVGVSDFQLIDQARVQAFADATGDQQWIHVDVERATREIGGPIVHGFLTLSLLPLLSAQLLQVQGSSRAINYGSDKVRFTSTLPVGTRLRLRQHCLSVEPKAGGKLLRMSSSFEAEGNDRPVCVAETLTLLFG